MTLRCLLNPWRFTSHEERESKNQYVRSQEGTKENVTKPVVQQAEWAVVDVFRDYPEHRARIAAAEKKFFKDKMKSCPSEDDESINCD